MAATVLVMDDDALMRDLLRMHLANAGYDVLVAEDAVIAGHLVVKRRPDLIIADIEMPFMDGLEFVTALKADASFCDIPVIIVSSRRECEDRSKELGAAAFLAKPVLAERLLAAVAKHVEPDGLDVFRRDEAAVAEERVRTRRLPQVDGGARAGAVLDVVAEILEAELERFAGGEHQIQDVLLHLLVDVDVVHHGASASDQIGSHHLVDPRRMIRPHPIQDLFLLDANVVDPAARGQGIGGALYEDVMAFAKAADATIHRITATTPPGLTQPNFGCLTFGAA